MATPTHDPPTAPNLSAFEGERFEKYHRIRDRLGQEPMAYIANLRLAGRARHRAGKPMLDSDGRQLIALPSFRDIAPVVERASGVPVTHETLRRWWLTAWPDGHPQEPRIADTNGVEEIRAAMHRARARSTNQAVPPAAFLPPADE